MYDDKELEKRINNPIQVLADANARVIENLMALDKAIASTPGQDLIRARNAYANNVLAFIQVQTTIMMMKGTDPANKIITLSTIN